MSIKASDILDRFRRGHGKDIDLTLRQPYRDLLARLGDPHLKLPPVVHVAGTNGKGSTCAFMRAAVEAAGYKAHVYTSPHLVSLHERIRIAGKLISEEDLAGILHECERLAEPGAITFFEAVTAAAFVAFARYPADLCILEVGLGGRLDATNVVPRPAATVITRLSYDHREYLGTTMAEIAREKAGIMRAQVPCYAAFQPSPEATVVLGERAASLHAPFVLGGRDWDVRPVNERVFRIVRGNTSLALPMPKLTGRHQMENAGLAMTALESVPLDLSDDARREAMMSVDWPARLQLVSKGSLPDKLPQGWELWLDGGHNDSAGEALAAQCAAWERQDGGKRRPFFVIFGMLKTKSPREFLAPLAPYIDKLVVVPIPDESLAAEPQSLAESAASLNINDVIVSCGVGEALSSLAAAAQKGENFARVLICGSLYLAGHVLRLNDCKA